MSKYQICVSGAHVGTTVEHSHILAYALGAAIAKAGHTLTTGATSGLPQYAARGAKDHGGLSIGFSPATSYREHVKSYKLPVKEFDYINFTGMNYVGRDLYLVQSSDAIITVGGGMGSLHEFSTAIEDHKPCAVLLGSGGTADFVPIVMERLKAPDDAFVIYDTDPERLIKQIVDYLDKKYSDLRHAIKTAPRKRGQG